MSKYSALHFLFRFMMPELSRKIKLLPNYNNVIYSYSE